jgi:predicted metalloprotease with PDZ domain
MLLASTFLVTAASLLSAAPPEKAPLPDTRPPAEEVTAILGLKLGMDTKKQVVILDVAPDSPANQIGVEKGDRLVSFDGHLVTTLDELVKFATNLISTKQSGEQIPLVVSRSGRSRTLIAVVPERTKPAPPTLVTGPDKLAVVRERNVVACMELRQADGGRLIVDKILDRSPPHAAGILPNDTIVSIGRLKVSNIAKFTDALSAYAPGDKIRIGLIRGDRPLIVEMISAPCQPVAAVVPVAPGTPAGPVVLPREKLSQQSLERLSARLKALQVQIDELRANADAIAAMIESMRE